MPRLLTAPATSTTAPSAGPQASVLCLAPAAWSTLTWLNANHFIPRLVSVSDYAGKVSP